MTTRFPCLSLEGGLFAADLIDQIADGTAPGQKISDFGLDGRRHLTDEIAAAWTEARTFWTAFSHRVERLSPDDPATSVTRDQWMIPFLSLLDYEPTYTPRAAEVDGQTYAISHRADSHEDAPPVHIVGCRQSLERRPESGRPRLAPHSLLQEYLNRTEHLWGLVTNGTTLRLLRDSHLIRRQAYIEFDLRQIMEAEKFADYALLYRLAHRTRLPHGMDNVQECLLERYYHLTAEQGGRVRDHLRDGVERALTTFANGFLHHPRNQALREAVREGKVKPLDFYQQLLLLIYRLLFLMVAEERRLITENLTYHQHYSITRLRRLVEERAAYTDHQDLWFGLETTFRLFQDEKVGKMLEVPPLNGDLFNAAQTLGLSHICLSNRELLTALWHLSMYRESERTPWRRINYAALDVEELGSVYESLLEFRPIFTEQRDKPVFELAAGTERKSTGSYYTPPELVNELVQSALVPIIEERLRQARERLQEHGQVAPYHGADPQGRSLGRPSPTGRGKEGEGLESVLLSIKVLDPACGSGHFLLAAARRLGKELARVRTGDDEPAPEQVRLALRDVITHCIYGVDKNPLAVDLCKVALWMEGHAKGKPLTFLDHRIRCGDSLIGVFDLAVLEKGIPDKAFDPVAGDDKAVARELKRQNRKEQEGQRTLFFSTDQELRTLADAYQQLVSLADDTPEQIRRKAEAYQKIHSQGTKWWQDNTACHLWTAAFFAELTQENRQKRRISTTDDLQRYLENPKAGYGPLVGNAWQLAQHNHFFHWPLEFPEVFSPRPLGEGTGVRVQGGFDVVLGNPPFMGGLKISGSFGDKYRHYLNTLYEPFKGTADLCAAFYRRVSELLKPEGIFGMVATNTIGQGDTREAGLAVIIHNDSAISFAHRFLKWPGVANVEVNLIAICKGNWKSNCFLDGQPVSFISSRLDDESEVEPKPLKQNEGKAFIGDYVRGIGFVLDLSKAQHLITEDPCNTDCLYPYLNGEDLNSNPKQKPGRSVICFHDWSLEKAKEYRDLLDIVEKRVKPERDLVKEKHERENWWLFARYRGELRQAIAPLQRVLVRSEVGELHMVAFVPKGWIYSHMVVVFAFNDDYHFALLQSNTHEIWVRRSASTMRTDVRYTPSDCFDTFPFPQDPLSEAGAWAEHIGANYQEHRRQIMLTRHLGLTKTYNLFHNPKCTDTDIVQLRDLHAEMDRAILACYGWSDLDPLHGFYQNERGQMRFTVAPTARRKILHRLLGLNQHLSNRGERR